MKLRTAHQRAGRAGREGGAWRVGYVNVQGLTARSWEAALRLLGPQFDLLFLGETWSMRRDVMRRNIAFVASSDEGPAPATGHPKGGICLLATKAARRQVVRCDTSKSTTLRCWMGSEEVEYAGVYFAPSMETAERTARLKELRKAKLILGDFNHRIQNAAIQHGHAGPPRFLRVMEEFQTRARCQHLAPKGQEIKLTSDHAYIRPEAMAHGEQAELTLLPAGRLLDTDHTYVLAVCFQQPVDRKEEVRPLVRFCIRKLQKVAEVERVRRRIVETLPDLCMTAGIDQMEEELVRYCQQIQTDTIGVAGEWKGAVQGPRGEQGLTMSIRLYKEAAMTSKENAEIIPTPEAGRRGMTAVEENVTILQKRWAGTPFQPSHEQESATACPWPLWTVDEVWAEINRQDAHKSCGADGIHIRFLQKTKDTGLITQLARLYNACLHQGQTPRIWNRSDICLIPKDVGKARDATNLRPLSIICIFRKVFERLLLVRLEAQPWAGFHAAQAGFRRGDSTLSNLAVVNTLCRSGHAKAMLFLDFKAAFDMVHHTKLDEKLRRRGCPSHIRRLIQGLMFQNLESRILINGTASVWFARLRGVLQGSPLSPWLFNVFVDDLLSLINGNPEQIPHCLFYADDGVVTAKDLADLHRAIPLIEQWTRTNELPLNPNKCAIVTGGLDVSQLTVYNTPIRQVDSYVYLGFPVGRDGIDFAQALQSRMTSAVGRTRWLSVHSDSWGPANRLRVYKQYIAPMFEYGAPLIWAWAKESADNQKVCTQILKGVGELMQWIGHLGKSRLWLFQNLCGLLPTRDRFRMLHTGYQLVLDQMNPSSPLKRLMGERQQQGRRWITELGRSVEFVAWKGAAPGGTPTKPKLQIWLRQWAGDRLKKEAATTWLAGLIPWTDRRVQGLRGAVAAFGAPIQMQTMLIRYRMGTALTGRFCICGKRFRRGHEECLRDKTVWQLGRDESKAKRKQFNALQAREAEREAAKALARIAKGKKPKTSVPPQRTFTSLDFLLNEGELSRAYAVLLRVQRSLDEIYVGRMIVEADILQLLAKESS